MINRKIFEITKKDILLYDVHEFKDLFPSFAYNMKTIYSNNPRVYSNIYSPDNKLMSRINQMDKNSSIRISQIQNNFKSPLPNNEIIALNPSEKFSFTSLNVKDLLNKETQRIPSINNMILDKFTNYLNKIVFSAKLKNSIVKLTATIKNINMNSTDLNLNQHSKTNSSSLNDDIKILKKKRIRKISVPPQLKN